MKFEDMIDQIICGDSLKVMPQIPDKSVDLILTSPPFKDEDIGLGSNDQYERIAREENRKLYLDWLEKVLSELERISSIIIMFNSSRRIVDICRRFNPERVLIWNKKRTEQPFRFEPIFIFNHSSSSINKGIWNDCISVMPILHQQTPYQNPVKLYETLIRYFPEAKLVLDPFIGSGTTAIAAQKLGRHFIGIDIRPECCEISRKRIANIPEKLDKFMEIK